MKTIYKVVAIVGAVLAMAFFASASALAAPPVIGIVVMHGKGGSPNGLVANMASALQGRGYLVANLEMPWSGRRNYDVNVAGAEQEVDAALDGLRAKGADKVFIVGHSQGGLFALYLGGRHLVDGIVSIAPGGNVGNAMFRDKLGASVEQARQLIADGKGDTPTRLYDYENAKDMYALTCTPANYLSWFDPEGAMNQPSAVHKLDARIPVLYIAPSADYQGLVRVNPSMFNALPHHALTKLLEPAATHVGAPTASVEDIVRWTQMVANSAH